jgi:hypothetical protein
MAELASRTPATGAGWLCEPADAPNESWMSDAYWVAANQPAGHEYYVRHRSGVSRAMAAMAFVKRADWIRQLFYGGDPYVTFGEITGFATCYSTRDPKEAQNAVCVLDGGAVAGPMTSAWLIGWGPRSVYLITPDGQPLSASGEFGLVVADWRYVLRTANVALNTSENELTAMLCNMIFRLPNPNNDSEKWRPTFYLDAGLCKKLPRNELRGIHIRETELFTDELRV